jgi:hypothetical protein
MEARISQNTTPAKKKGSCRISIVSGMIAWEHIFTALEFILTPTACCAASMKPWTETILDDVPHYPVEQSVSDTGRPGQKLWKTDFSLLYYYFCDYSLSLGLLCLF